ncbi:MAG: FtsX-like permease family protein [Candidatus Latescibacteria bacterium]|nr:FtsX-like permease family protein [Candidatus Latescibacterota bacterium]
MLRNYLLTAGRALRRHPFYALANLGGLTVALAGCLLMAVYILDQLEYDRYPQNSERVYRLYERSERGVRTSLSAALGPALQDRAPQVEAVVRLLNPDNPAPLVRHGDKRFYTEYFHFADPAVLAVFSLDLLRGEAATALAEPFSVVLSESAAQRLFGQADPLGQIIRFKEALSLEVTGVMPDMPRTSHLRIDYLASFATVEKWLGAAATGDWQRRMFRTYLQLRPGADADDLSKVLTALWEQVQGQSQQSGAWALQPLQRIHLYSLRDLGVGGGDIGDVVLLALAAGLLLVVACLNYANLGAGLAARRAREVGLRRTLGADAGQLVRQFVCESALGILLAMAAALALAAVLAPVAGQIIGAELSLDYTSLQMAGLVSLMAAVALVLAGGYPVVFPMRMGVLQALAGGARMGGGKSRKIMVVGQFLLSLSLLTATAIVYQQLRFIDTVDLGFGAEQVLVVPLRDSPLRGDPSSLKGRLQQVPGVVGTSAAALLPAGPLGQREFRSVQAPTDGQPVGMDLLWVDADFIATLGLEVVAGVGFAAGLEPRQGYFVVSQGAVTALGWASAEEAIGQPLDSGRSSGSGVSPSGTIVGVVGDFHAGSVRRGVRPLVLQLWPWPNYLLVRFQTGAAEQVLEGVEGLWAEFDVEHPFEYWFLEDGFARMYEGDQRLGRVLAGFGGLALLVACSGLFGVASFAAQKRKKEFGIRKVHGASSLQIGRLLGGEFTLLVLAAGTVACPLAVWGMGPWRDGFAIRADIDLGVFAWAMGGTLLAAWGTVAYYAVRASTANPIEALRSE